MAQDRRFQSAEAEIAAARQMRRIPIDMRQPGFRERHRAVVAAAGKTIDDRPTRISQVQQLGDLVVRLTRRVVSCTSEQLVRSWSHKAIQAGMATRYDQ